ncbi:MAG: glycosyltransferase family protein [Proteobacteria bacterium]|nr:glycosyltransferase family protein [Pseudomonadota bacterium]
MFKKIKQKIVCTIEARMTSNRLPGKVLLPLAGKPALERLIERIRRSTYVNDIVVATTINRDDQPIVALCEKIGCFYHRGSEEDVLSRVLGAAKSVDGNIIVEITGDCPLIDHRHIDKTIEVFFSGDYDYAANTVERSFPDGFDVQVFPVNLLEKVAMLTQDPIDRVHVSYYIWNHPKCYKLANWKAQGDMYWPSLGLTLDEKDDYQLIDKIYKELFSENNDFSAEDIIAFLRKRPDLTVINAHVRRKVPEEG